MNEVKQNSLIAYHTEQERFSRCEQIVYNAIKSNPGITREGLCRVTQMHINSICGRVNGLLKKDAIIEGASVINQTSKKPNATLWIKKEGDSIK